MKKIICDRCGKEIENIRYEDPFNILGARYKLTSKTGFNVQSYDLCPECAQQFTEWAENPDSIILDANKFDRVNVVSPEELEKILKNAMECMDDCDYAMTKVSNTRVEDAINEWNTAYNRFRGSADE